MPDHDAIHVFLYQDCILRIPRNGTLDLIVTNPPQTLTPPIREWDDPQSLLDTGGSDDRSILDRIIHHAPDYLKPHDRLVFALFGILGIRRAEEKLEAAGLHPRTLSHAEQAFPRIARERLEYIWALDAKSALPPGPPTTCSRLVLDGQKG